MRSAVDNVDLMERYCMNNFFSFLYLAFGAPDKFGLLLPLENPEIMMQENVHLLP